MTTTWLHTHLPRLQAGDPNPVSVKIPGQKIAYASWVSMRDVEFKVSEAGRQRCLREGVRNVHAWVVGTEVRRIENAPVVAAPPAGYRRALYSPFKGEAFVDSQTKLPVYSASMVIVSGKNVYYVV